jgi:hypothetical protein
MAGGVFAGQKLGIKQVDDGIWLVGFMHYDLRYFDLEQAAVAEGRDAQRVRTSAAEGGSRCKPFWGCRPLIAAFNRDWGRATRWSIHVRCSPFATEVVRRCTMSLSATSGHWFF